ncbi:MAG: NYN domain-containing protein [Chthoniobacter sp.]|nr:NYN domain-containing protein [Chthoniobacter sp.]
MRYLIVDGHSVIFAWPELRKLHTRRTELARNELVKILTEYQDASDVRVVAVFDGKGEKSNEATEPGGIQIFYSAAGQTADAIVERLVAKYAGQHEITVATDDHMEQQTATSFGALVVSSAGLRPWLEDAQRDLARRLKQHRRK